MTTSLHLPSSSFTSFRTNGVRQRIQPCHSCNAKLYMVPIRVFSFRSASRAFASVGSLETGVVGGDDNLSSATSTPNDFGRSKTSFDGTLDGMKFFETQLQGFFDEVKAMIAMGNRSDAIDLLQANYEAVKERINAGARGMEEVALMDVIALGYMALGDLKFVATLLDNLKEVVGSIKDDEPLMDIVLVHMGSMYSTLKKFEKSTIVYGRAINIMENKYGNNSVFLVSPILSMAKVLGSVGRATKAATFYNRAVTILELSKGRESEDLVMPLSGLGNLLLKQGKAKEAEVHFVRILNIYKKLYGEADGRVGLAMCSVAHAKCAMGNANEAIHLYKNALQVIKDTNYMALDDSRVEKIRVDLAELLHSVGRVKEGRELLEECLLIAEEYRGKEHPSIATHLMNLATSHSRTKNFAEAEHLLRTSLDIMSKTVGHDDPSMTFPMLHLAVTLYHLTRDEEAEQLALEALHIREKAFGEDSLPVAEALDSMVSIQIRLMRDDSFLLEQLKRILDIQEREFGYESEEVLTTLKKVSFFLDKLGKKDEKLSLQKRLSTLRTKFKQRIQY